MPAVVTFDPINLEIVEINTGLAENVTDAAEIYSEWKLWLLSDPQNRGYPQAFRAIGGDPRSVTANLGASFFVIPPWKLRGAPYTHKWTVEGNLFNDFAAGGVGSVFAAEAGVHYETVVTDLITGLASIFDKLTDVHRRVAMEIGQTVVVDKDADTITIGTQVIRRTVVGNTETFERIA